MTTVERQNQALSDCCRIEHELGAGGMATLNREHNLTHERAAAIKPVAPDPGTALGVERCIGEIRELTPSLTGGR